MTDLEAFKIRYGDTEWTNFFFREVLKGVCPLEDCKEGLKEKFKCVLLRTDLKYIEIQVLMEYPEVEWYRRNFTIYLDGNMQHFNTIMQQLNEQYLGRIDSKSIKRIRDRVESLYSTNRYKIFCVEQNELRYVFREVCNYVVNEYGLGSDKQVKLSILENATVLPPTRYLQHLEELIRCGVLISSVSTRRVLVNGECVGISDKHYIGVTEYGWSVYKEL